MPNNVIRFAALLAFLLLGACGGGGPTTPPGVFVAPKTALDLPMGAGFDVHVTRLPALETVVLTLDGDGDPGTKGDAHVIAGPLMASLTGEIETWVSTEGVPAGEHRLLAVRFGTTHVLAMAAPRVDLARLGWIVSVATPADERLLHARALGGGRVAVGGVYTGETTVFTASGPVTLPGKGGSNAFVGAFAGGGLVGVEAITGPEYDNPLDLAAAPDGGFSVAGFAFAGPVALGLPVHVPTAPAPGDRSIGFLGTYDRSAAPTGGVLSWGIASGGEAAESVQVTAVAHGPDGARWVALHSWGNLSVGGRDTTLLVPGGGAAIARLGETGVAEGPFVTLAGDLRVVGLEFGAHGQLFVAGTCWQTVTFGPEHVADGGFDGKGFLARYDATGTCTGLLTPTGGTGPSSFNDMAIGADGVVYLAGGSEAPVAFGGARIDTVPGGMDGFVLAVSSDLVPLWARAWTWWLQPMSSDYAQVICEGVTALPGGGCALAGATTEGANIGGVLVGKGQSDFQDAAVARYGPDGALQWVLIVGGEDVQTVGRIDADAEGNLLIPGGTRGTLTLTDRDGPTSFVFGGGGGFDAFLLRLDPDGRVAR
jgi:hypothetical protein